MNRNNLVILRGHNFSENFWEYWANYNYYDTSNDQTTLRTTIAQSIIQYYNTNGLFRNIINLPAQDAVRQDIIINNEYAQDILKELNKQKYRSYFEKALRIARLFGSALVVLNIQTGDATGDKYEEEITENTTITDFKIQYIFNPNEFYIVKDKDKYPLDWDYYEVSTSNTKIKIHKTRAILITFQELQMRADRLFEGSMFLHLLEDITRYDDSLETEANLIIQSQREIIQTDFEKHSTGMGDSDDLENVRESMREVLKQNEIAKKTGGSQIIGSDDKITRIQSVLTGYADVTNNFKDKISASVGIPKMLLFGETINGLSNESNTVLSNYYSSIASLQEDCLRNAYTKMIYLVCKKNKIEIDDYGDFTFAKLWQIDDKEKSEIMLNYTNALEKAINNDFITKEEARNLLEQNKLINFVAIDEKNTKMKDKNGEFDFYSNEHSN